MADEDTPVPLIDVAGTPPRTGRLRFDLIAAIMAIFISLVSLVVAIRSEATQDALLAASSWPFIQVSLDRNTSQDAPEDQISVENAGVGPAKIMTFEVFLDGQPVDGVVDLLHRCCGVDRDFHEAVRANQFHLTYGGVADNVMRPGDRIVTLKLKPGEAGREIFDRFDQSLAKVTVSACYCSILDRCWVSDLRGLSPKPVDRCPPAKHPFDYSFDAPTAP